MKKKKLNTLGLVTLVIGSTLVLSFCCGCNSASDSSTPETGRTADATQAEESAQEKSAKLIDATLFTLDAPFTTCTWATTVEHLKENEGEPASTYKSVYGGTTYVYRTSYEGRDGSVKYMFDDKDALMCVAFTYVPESADEVMGFYTAVHDNLVKELGASEYQADHDTNYGDVWYREEGDIVVSCMVTSEQNSLQYSYLNPIVSKYQMEAAVNQ